MSTQKETLDTIIWFMKENAALYNLEYSDHAMLIGTLVLPEKNDSDCIRNKAN